MAEVTPIFVDLKDRLIELLDKWPHGVVAGCVAWFTDIDIIEAIGRHSSAIIVQKEDFLRPDGSRQGAWKQRLRDAYETIGETFRPMFSPPLSECSILSDNGIGVRCVGLCPKDRNSTSPKMHHKFLVFYEHLCHEPEYQPYLKPKAVWTGSFNFTNNSSSSRENALFIRSEAVAEAYHQEFCKVAAMSEPLDWESEFVAPEWRIGT
jgi:phosphatidylserine/phosphatidylglycerophosphate/cardiolipin synthase-like enzyme